MRKFIAAINMTLDGYCDHTLGIADDEIHQHYANVINDADDIFYGRTTYQLMESYWPMIVENPTGEAATDGFANAIDKIRKIVFSRTLQQVTWKNARLATKCFEEEVLELKGTPGRTILVGSPGLIAAAIELSLIDEFHICIQPIIAGKGLTLMKHISEKKDLKLMDTRLFKATGSMLMYYRLVK